MTLARAATILGIVVLSYFVVLNLAYIMITTTALIHVRGHMDEQRYEPLGNRRGNPFVPGVAIVVPAYNEGPVIVETVRSLLSLEYPNTEIIVVNDGSTDETLERLRDAFPLNRVEAEYPIELPSEPLREVFRAEGGDLTVLDKENGGKADALNAGLFYSEQDLFCAIDADSIIEHGSLYDAIEPFLEHPTETVATGGAVRVANGCRVEHGVVRNVNLSRNRLVTVQVVEYLRAFLAGRIGLSRLNSLMIISGAFGLFRADTLREIGGYETDSITEDMEVVVRLHRHLTERGEPYRIEFLPEPVVWTEVPESSEVLGRQRRRWYRGQLDTISRHWELMGNRQYGAIGIFGLPFFLFIESVGPLVEGAGYVLIPLMLITGWLHAPFFLSFFALAMFLGAILSGLGVFLEVSTYRRYTRNRDIVTLLGYGVIEAFVYRPWKAYHTWRAFIEYLRGDTTWGEMTRVGFDSE